MKSFIRKNRGIIAVSSLLVFAVPSIRAATANLPASLPFPLAQIPTNVKTGFQYGLGILFMVGFIWGVINIWGGADKLKRGDADGKMGIVSGIIIAGAAAIMAALFYIFGMSDGALPPQF
jgi:hypothetical protein